MWSVVIITTLLVGAVVCSYPAYFDAIYCQDGDVKHQESYTCLDIHNKSLTWQQAFDACEMALQNIERHSLNTFLADTLEHGKKYWVGKRSLQETEHENRDTHGHSHGVEYAEGGPCVYIEGGHADVHTKACEETADGYICEGLVLMAK